MNKCGRLYVLLPHDDDDGNARVSIDSILDFYWIHDLIYDDISSRHSFFDVFDGA